MTYIDDLTTARDQVASLIKDITLNPKPSYSIDGQSISWTQYLAELSRQIEQLNKSIAGGKPFEIQSLGYH